MKERKFDTDVQRLKYLALREVAKLAWEDRLIDGYYEIPKKVISGNTPSMRCCVSPLGRLGIAHTVPLQEFQNYYSKPTCVWQEKMQTNILKLCSSM